MKQVISHPKFWPILLGGIALTGLSLLGAPWWVLWLTLAVSVLLIRLQINVNAAPSSTQKIPSHIAPEVLASYIRSAPNASVLVSQNARIVLFSDELASLFPNVELDHSFAQAFRTPALIDAFLRALSGKKVAPLRYKSTRYTDRIFAAKFTVLKEPFAELLGAYLMIEFEDITQSEHIEAARRDFVANASHELRTPLTTIQGGIETLSQYDDDPAAAKRFLPIMKSQADRMQRLIDDLMSLSKIEGQSPVTKDMRFNLTATLKEVVSIYDAQDNHVKIDNQFGKAKLEVRGDADQITQVLINLIDNAIKYSGSDRIEILRTKGEGKQKGQIKISVKDFGEGVPQKHIARLSQRFYRANDKQKTGTGLGLSIVKHILRRHGSALEIESQLGIGSTFSFWLDTK